MPQKGKITMMQATLLYLIMIYSANMRIIPAFVVAKAEQAGWISASIGSITLIIVIIIIKSFVTNYPNQAFSEVICDIMGKPIGKFIITLFIIWLSILLSLYIRYFGERLVSSIYISTDINIFTILLLVLIFFLFRTGLQIIARMNKIIFILIATQFFLIMALLLTRVEVDNITPISSLDIVPILEGTIGVTGIWIYIFFLYMVSDQIITRNDFNKNMIWMVIFLFSVTTLLVINLLGIFGSNLMMKIPLPLLFVVKNISKTGEFTGLEALFMSLWILADFITVGLFAHIIIRLIKSLFNIDNPMYLLSIYLIFQFILAQYLSSNIFELQAFSKKLGLQMNVIMGFCFPILIFCVGKLRKKLLRKGF